MIHLSQSLPIFVFSLLFFYTILSLAAIESTKNLDAIVSAFDVRSTAKEQVESMSIMFLEIDLKETGDDAKGYAKDMSPEWFEAARKVLLRECAKTNAIITTALIPGKKAPLLIIK